MARKQDWQWRQAIGGEKLSYNVWTKLGRQNMMIYPGRQKFSEEFYKYMHTTQELEMEDRKGFPSGLARGG